MNVSSIIAQVGIVPVIRLDHPERDAANLAKALCAGGVPIAEITFRAAGADQAIRIMRDTNPDMLVGAGTVLTLDQVDAAQAAGASFAVSPGFNPKTVERCQAIGLPIFPGCVTPTEIEWALSYGLTTLKFFPAEQYGGLKTISALSAPYQMIKFLPTGGISLKNLGEYSANKAVVACGGSYMVTADLLNNGKWDEITALCKQSIEVIKNARG